MALALCIASPPRRTAALARSRRALRSAPRRAAPLRIATQRNTTQGMI